jgi:hypothetical protein
MLKNFANIFDYLSSLALTELLVRCLKLVFLEREALMIHIHVVDCIFPPDKYLVTDYARYLM